MYLTQKSAHFPSFSPFRAVAKRSAPNNFDLLCRSFDESVLRRLQTLALPTSLISLSWLTLAVDVISATHTEAQALISKFTSSSTSSDDSRSFYLDHSVKLLDICNSISSEIENLRHRRLLVKFVLHLLEFPGDGEIPAPDKIRRAKDSLIDWEKNMRVSSKRRGFEVRDPEVLIRDLATSITKIEPRGKISSVDKAIVRTIYAVGLITVFVAGVAISALHGLPETAKVHVPADFLWADSFKNLQSSIFNGERKVVVLGEMVDVKTRVSKVRDGLDDVVCGEGIKEKKGKLGSAVKELETVTERLSEGLDRFADGVNGMFRNVLSTRNNVLENFRVESKEEKHHKRK